MVTRRYAPEPERLFLARVLAVVRVQHVCPTEPELVGSLQRVPVDPIAGGGERNSGLCRAIVRAFATWGLPSCSFKCHLQLWAPFPLIQVPKNLLARNGRLGID